MGIFDRLMFETGLEVEFPDISGDPFNTTWQTKSITRYQPLMEKYKVTTEGYLLKQEVEYEHVPEKERPYYDENSNGFENSFERVAGSMKKVHQGWTDTSYHGVFEFHV